MINVMKRLWFFLPQKIRFLMVGGFNTAFSYLLFLLFTEVWDINYRIAVILQYVLTVNLSIFSFRTLVFCSHGNLLSEYIKAWGVYVFMLGFNFAALVVMIEYLGLRVWLAQGIYILISTVITFLLHRYFSFRS